MLEGSHRMERNGLMPKESGALKSIFAQLDTEGKATLLALLGRLAQEGVSPDVLEARLHRGLLVASWRADLAGAPQGSLYADAAPLAEPQNSETRLLAETFFAALSAEISENPEKFRVQQIFIGYDNQDNRTRLLSEFPVLKNVRLEQNQLSGKALAVGRVAVEARQVGASSLPVYTARELDTRGSHGFPVERHRYSLTDVMRHVMDIRAKVLVFA